MVFHWRFMFARIRNFAWVSLVISANLAVGAEENPSPEITPPPTAPTIQPAVVQIQQGTLPNPVTDEVTLIHRRQLSPAEPEPLISLPAMIKVKHETEKVSYAWDPIECRLLLVWKGDSMADLIYVAEGPAPFAASIGVWGPPDYFGYRMIDGAPEFLYHFGRIGVAERIIPLPDGSGITQHWEVHQADYGLQVSVPERWKPRVKSSAGSWSGLFLKVGENDAKDFTLTWTWPESPDLPELTKSWTAALVVPAPEEKPDPKTESKPE